MTANKHTPTPTKWHTEEIENSSYTTLRAPNKRPMATIFDSIIAKDICRKLNSHPGLVDALRHIRQACCEAMPYGCMQKGVSQNILNTIKQALKDAGGEQCG